MEAVAQACSAEKMLLQISQNSQKNICARVSFSIKLQALGPRSATLLKKRLWHRCFSVNFVKFLRTPFCIEHLWWLLLKPQLTNIVNHLGWHSFAFTFKRTAYFERMYVFCTFNLGSVLSEYLFCFHYTKCEVFH